VRASYTPSILKQAEIKVCIGRTTASGKPQFRTVINFKDDLGKRSGVGRGRSPISTSTEERAGRYWRRGRVF